MFEEKQFHETCKEMRSIVTMDEVKEFISLARNEEYECDERARNLEFAMESKYLDLATKNKIKDAIAEERTMARKWNALWTIFDHAEYHSVKS